jgi:hypothetical protein
MVMKQSQWAIAAIVLAALVFIVTFAMNYLGSGTQDTIAIDAGPAGGELNFFWKNAPSEHDGIQAEEKSAGSYDFWFRNDGANPVQVGLEQKGCKCTSVQLFVLPTEKSLLPVSEAAALLGSGSLGYVPFFALHAVVPALMQQIARDPEELILGPESVPVPEGGVGWVRMSWKAEKIGGQILQATLTFDGKASGRKAILQTRVYFHEPLRVIPSFQLGVLNEQSLAAGVHQDIICWSSTRQELRLEVQSSGRSNPASDPFVVGAPEPLSPAERFHLWAKNNSGEKAAANATFGMVLCAYRIRVTLKAVARDGTPCDIGPFYRRVTISCPDINSEPKQVTIHGRVRGLVEIGNDDEGSQINFSTFPRSRGKTEKIGLQSEVSDLKLEFDDKQTPSYLKATLSAPDKKDGRQSWELRATVKPGQASGVFPRREDPFYEDSAIYLKAYQPGKPVRRVRIGVQGTANER